MLRALIILGTLAALLAAADAQTEYRAPSQEHEYDHPHGYQHDEGHDRVVHCYWRGGHRHCDHERDYHDEELH